MRKMKTKTGILEYFESYVMKVILAMLSIQRNIRPTDERIAAAVVGLVKLYFSFEGHFQLGVNG